MGGDDLSNIIDRLAAFISPRWAYQREAWKAGIDQIKSYDAGNSGRLNGGWTRVNASASQTDRPYRDTIRARARDLERNSDIAESIVLAFSRNVIGCGFRLQSMVYKQSGEDDDVLNQAIEDLWAEWCKPFNCDLTRQQSLSEMARMAMRRLRYDGGIIFVKVYEGGGILPFKLQAREVDELDTSVIKSAASPAENIVIDGIEYDKYHRPVAYYFKTYTVDGFWVGQNERIDAKRVIFLWEKRRPSQVREMSPMANSLTRIRDTNQYMEAVSIQARIMACLSVFIKKINPTGGFGRAGGSVDAESGYKEATLTPGMINYLQPGEDAQFLNPGGQAQNAKDYLGFMQRINGAGQGLSYEVTSRDMSQVTYSSARQGLLEDKRTYQEWQKYFVDHFYDEIFFEFILSAILAGALPITVSDFFANKAKYTRHKFIASGWDWIDPQKEANANQTALNTGQSTLAEVTASKGGDWKDNIEQRARELAYAKKLGINLEGGEITVEQDETEVNGENAAES